MVGGPGHLRHLARSTALSNCAQAIQRGAFAPTSCAQGREEHWRYLGMVQNGDCEIEEMLNALTAQIGDADLRCCLGERYLCLQLCT